MRLLLNPNEQTKRCLLFGTLLLWCVALLLGRVVHSGQLAFGFLVWNLFLAVIPAFAAWLFAKAVERRAAVGIQAAWFALWLAFLPNAPYIITDFMHLHARPPVPLWYDIALIGSCAGTGLLLGYSSLGDVHCVIAHKFSAGLGWAMAFVVLLLSGFGIYLGRFLRWNSWDALLNPFELFSSIAGGAMNPRTHSQPLAFTLIYGVALLLGYVALRVLQDRPQAVSGK